MSYSPQAGDIGLTQISGFGGKLIRLGQYLNGDGSGDFEHAFVYVGGNMIVEAMPGGADYTQNWHDWSKTHWLRCPQERRGLVHLAAIGLVDTPYSYADYFALAAHRLHIPVPGLRKYVLNSKSMICSQLADAAAYRGGWHLFKDNRWAGDVTPGDLEALYQEQDYA